MNFVHGILFGATLVVHCNSERERPRGRGGAKHCVSSTTIELNCLSFIAAQLNSAGYLSGLLSTREVPLALSLTLFTSFSLPLCLAWYISSHLTSQIFLQGISKCTPALSCLQTAAAVCKNLLPRICWCMFAHMYNIYEYLLPSPAPLLLPASAHPFLFLPHSHLVPISRSAKWHNIQFNSYSGQLFKAKAARLGFVFKLDSLLPINLLSLSLALLKRKLLGINCQIK